MGRADPHRASASRYRNVGSRSALGRSERRDTISTVGRTTGASEPAARAHATSPQAARALEGPEDARSRASSSGRGSPARAAISPNTSHLPRCLSASLSTARAGEMATGSAGWRRSGTNTLDAQRDPVALLDLRGERRDVRAVRLAPGDARHLGGERQVRVARSGDPRERVCDLRRPRSSTRKESRGRRPLPSERALEGPTPPRRRPAPRAHARRPRRAACRTRPASRVSRRCARAGG